jgi:hypothetical protein
MLTAQTWPPDHTINLLWLATAASDFIENLTSQAA